MSADLSPEQAAPYRLTSNLQEIGQEPTLAKAKARAKAESRAYEDVVVVERGARELYMAHYGSLYRLVPTR